MNHLELPPCEELWENIEYAPLTGKIYWRTQRSPANKVGDECGWQGGPYRYITFKSVSYKTHRVIWKWMTGDDPEHSVIDHQYDYVDSVYKSNYWWNLRKAGIENGYNRKLGSNNTSG